MLPVKKIKGNLWTKLSKEFSFFCHTGQEFITDFVCRDTHQYDILTYLKNYNASYLLNVYRPQSFINCHNVFPGRHKRRSVSACSKETIEPVMVCHSVMIHSLSGVFKICLASYTRMNQRNSMVNIDNLMALGDTLWINIIRRHSDAEQEISLSVSLSHTHGIQQSYR